MTATRSHALARFAADARQEALALAAWWLQEMKELLADLRHRLTPKQPTSSVLRVSEAGDCVLEQSWSDREPTSTALADSDDTAAARLAGFSGVRTRVLLPESWVLIRRLHLPVTASSRLDEIVGLHLERELPLPGAAVHVDWQPVAGEVAGGSICVEIAVVRRDTIKRLAAKAAAHGLRMSTVGLGAFDFNRRSRPRSAVVIDGRSRVAAAAVGCLALLYVAIVAAQWTYERVQVSRELAASAPAAESVEGLTEQLRARQGPLATVQRLIDAPSATHVLLALTKTIGTDSWVQQAEIGIPLGGPATARLSAWTPSAATLIATLEAAPEFEQAQLLSAGGGTAGASPDRAEITVVWSAAAAPRHSSAGAQ
jgi:hypothetical protein